MTDKSGKRGGIIPVLGKVRYDQSVTDNCTIHLLCNCSLWRSSPLSRGRMYENDSSGDFWLAFVTWCMTMYLFGGLFCTLYMTCCLPLPRYYWLPIRMPWISRIRPQLLYCEHKWLRFAGNTSLQLQMRATLLTITSICILYDHSDHNDHSYSWLW